MGSPRRSSDVSKDRGLPDQLRMRHDSHFVEELTSQHGESVGRHIDIRRIEPNPHQPRKSFGDLSEMVDSIKEKGILEPILVRAHDGKYQIIAGERRYQAARLAGLQRLPCIEVDVDARGMLEISLIENLQRKDLTPFEEAAALQRLCDQFRYTHDEVARKLGKSRTVVTEALSLNRMPEDVQERCRRADIVSKSMLLQIVRLETPEAMHKLVDRITGEGMTREEARQFKRDDGSGKPPRQFTFRYQPEDKGFQLRLTFRKPEVERRELIRALQDLLQRLEREPEEALRGGAGRARSASRQRPERPGARPSASLD
jgi:ParB family chromosome partitioning protein